MSEVETTGFVLYFNDLNKIVPTLTRPEIEGYTLVDVGVVPTAHGRGTGSGYWVEWLSPDETAAGVEDGKFNSYSKVCPVEYKFYVAYEKTESMIA